MLLRVFTNDNYLDIDLKETFDIDRLIEAIDNSSTVLIETKRDTKFLLNTVNIIAIEIINIPPINSK